MVKCTENELSKHVSMVSAGTLLSDLCDRIEAIEGLLPMCDMEERVNMLENAKGILINLIEEIKCEGHKFAKCSIVPEDKLC